MKHPLPDTLAVILSLLVFASLIGFALRLIKGPGNPTIVNLNQRITTWWVIILVAGGALLCGTYATILLFMLCAFLALREFISLTPTKPADYWPLLLAFYVALPGQFLLLAMHWYGMVAIFIPVYMVFCLSAAAAFGADTESFLERTGKLNWAVMVCIYGLSYAPALLLLNIPGHASAPLMLFLLVVVQASDVCQYVFGKLFGRTKLAPLVSPSKTVEGLLGGGASAILIGMLLHGLTPFSVWQAAPMSLAIVIGGFAGGLVLSGVKRSLGAKDWGTMFAGHGGMLDRVDSICFAAPLFFHLTRFFFT
jgi:phosphatidate cytidylyltransferase